MKPPTEHEFGGDWTSEKLLRVSKYLSAYTTIMKDYNFHYLYVDAFAGTGYRTLKHEGNPSELLLPEFAEPEAQSFVDGSAKIALKVEHSFHRYIFIDKFRMHLEELEKLKKDFPHLSDRIEIKEGEANEEILTLCKEKNWITANQRAVLFLDPYGMQVSWHTVEAIAQTEAIDLWYLFPLGIGLNRLLKTNGKIDDSIRKKIDDILGEKEWFDVFYRHSAQVNFLESKQEFQKTADFGIIEKYFVDRLKSVFTKVAQNPLSLRNSKGNPLYLLCFAAGNPKGATTAVKIAQDILEK